MRGRASGPRRAVGGRGFGDTRQGRRPGRRPDGPVPRGTHGFLRRMHLANAPRGDPLSIPRFGSGTATTRRWFPGRAVDDVAREDGVRAVEGIGGAAGEDEEQRTTPIHCCRRWAKSLRAIWCLSLADPARGRSSNNAPKLALAAYRALITGLRSCAPTCRNPTSRPPPGRSTVPETRARCTTSPVEPHVPPDSQGERATRRLPGACGSGSRAGHCGDRNRERACAPTTPPTRRPGAPGRGRGSSPPRR